MCLVAMKVTVICLYKTFWGSRVAVAFQEADVEVFFPPKSVTKIRGLVFVFIQHPKVWWSELHAPRGCFSFFVGGWGGKSLSRIPSFLSGYTKKHCGPQWPFKKSSARHIQSGAAHPQRAQLGTPAKKALTVSYTFQKKETKFTGALRRFLGTTTKICQGITSLKTHKNPLEKLTIGYRKITHCSNRKYHPCPTHSGSIFQPAQRDTPGNEVII